MHRGDFQCIAVDMGAGSIRVMLGTIGKSIISYREVHRFSNRIITRNGHDGWDMDHIVRGIRDGIRQTVGRAGSPVQSIGVDSWGVDYVVTGEDGSVEKPVIAYRDNRTEGLEEEWAMIMSREETFRRTGINFYVFNTLYQLLAQQKEEPLGNASRILFMPAYINFLLSGVAGNELTISSTSQMLGIEGNEWDMEILSGLGIDRKVLGPVIDPGARLGEVIWSGLQAREMMNIAVCGHDTACVVAALPVEDPAFAYVSAGTWCIVGIESPWPYLGKGALELGFTNERGYGNSYRILKNLTGLWLIQGLREAVPGKPGYDELEKMTLLAGESVQVIDPDDPVFYNPANMKDAFDSWLLSTGQDVPGEISGYLRCAYNSICFSIRYYLEQLETLSGREIRVLHMVGGGSQSAFLNQRVADICRRKVVAGPVEGATLGNVIVQGISLGRISDLEEGRIIVSGSFPGKVFLPHKDLERLSSLYESFLKLKKV